MKSLLKKNQVMITALAIMIAVAGYLNFAGSRLNEEELLEAGSNSVTAEGTVLENQASADIVQEDYDLASALDISDEDSLELADIDSLDYDLEGSADTGIGEAGAEVSASGAAGGDVAVSGTAGDSSVQNEVPGEAVFTSTSNVASLSGAKLMKEQTRAKNKETLLNIINSETLNEEQKQTAVNSMISMTDIAEKETAAEILLEAKGFGDVVVSISSDMVDVVVNAAELSEQQRAQIEDIVKRKTGMSSENIIISPVASK